MFVFTFIINLFLFLTISSWANAITDPLAFPNNKIGVHILFPDELDQASKLVNNENKGEWGYAVIPIQASDRNRQKWQKFLDACKEKKIIPIIRVATVPEGSNWAKPDSFDLIDFANFLGDLHWPIQNRYVIIFNEVNRSDEYGGFVSPENYADILANASDIFKAVSSDFFILPAGLDNAAPNAKGYMNHRRYIEKMYLHRPDIFDKIDGWTSHAYPNPDFSSRPDSWGVNRINSFVYDLRLIHQFSTKKLPVFITETGWSSKKLSETQINFYYQYTIKKVWSDERIVTIAPFLLNAQDGPFTVFSLTKKDGQFYEYAKTLSQEATKGSPILPSILDVSTPQSTPSSAHIPAEDGQSKTIIQKLIDNITSFFGVYK